MKPGFFRDDSGQPSCVRLMSLLAFIMACKLALLDAMNEGDVDPMHIYAFLTAAFAPKVVQKFAEKVE